MGALKVSEGENVAPRSHRRWESVAGARAVRRIFFVLRHFRARLRAQNSILRHIFARFRREKNNNKNITKLTNFAEKSRLENQKCYKNKFFLTKLFVLLCYFFVYDKI